MLGLFLKSKYKLPFLILSASIIIGGILFLVRINPDKQTEEKIFENQESYIYQSASLGIKFDYPVEWGQLEFKAEPCFSEERGFFSSLEGEPCAHIFLLAPSLENNPLVVSAQSRLFADYQQEREQYFGDLISVARRSGADIGEFINKYCVNEAQAKNAEKCSASLNSNNVPYVKVLQEPIIEKENNKDRVLYYIVFHKGHNYEGIIFSSEFYPEDVPLNKVEAIFDKVIDTLEFI